MLQQLAMAVLVAGAFAYSAWALMPAAWRSSLRRRLGWPVPAAGSGCGGCGGGCATRATANAATSGTAATAVITLHRRPAQAGAGRQLAPAPPSASAASAGALTA